MLQRFVDAWMAFPGLLLLLTIMSLVGRGLPQIIVVLGVTGGIGSSRIVRSAVIGVKENVYFQAAVAIGCLKGRILMRYVLPNIAAPVIIIFTINIGAVIISEAALSKPILDTLQTQAHFHLKPDLYQRILNAGLPGDFFQPRLRINLVVHATTNVNCLSCNKAGGIRS